MYDLCAKYRSGVLVCYIKKPWWEIPVTANIVPSQRIVPMGGDKKSATINDSGFGAGASTYKVKITINYT